MPANVGGRSTTRTAPGTVDEVGGAVRPERGDPQDAMQLVEHLDGRRRVVDAGGEGTLGDVDELAQPELRVLLQRAVAAEPERRRAPRRRRRRPREPRGPRRAPGRGGARPRRGSGARRPLRPARRTRRAASSGSAGRPRAAARSSPSTDGPGCWDHDGGTAEVSSHSASDPRSSERTVPTATRSTTSVTWMESVMWWMNARKRPTLASTSPNASVTDSCGTKGLLTGAHVPQHHEGEDERGDEDPEGHLDDPAAEEAGRAAVG